MSKNIPLQNLPYFLRELFERAVDRTLKRLGQRAVTELGKLFKSEGSSLDVEWSPLQAAYLAQKLRAGHSEKILHKTTTLSSSFGYTLDQDEVLIGTPVPYAPFMEWGTKKGIPSRPFIYPVGRYIVQEGIPGEEFAKALRSA